MTLRELIQDLERAAAVQGDDAEFTLYDRTNEREFHVNPDADVFDFELLHGDRAVVVEFDS